MARKSKRMVLNDAIRQGQARIEEGLKSGRMRSDNPHAYSSGNKERMKAFGPETMWQSPLKSEGVLSKSKYVLLRIFSSGRNRKIAGAVALALLIGLVLNSWIGNTPQSPDHMTATPGSANMPQEQDIKGEKATSSSFSDLFKKADSDETTATKTADESTKMAPASRQGDNVIWIQSIDPARQSELLPLKSFFERKGIATEIIMIRANTSEKAVLVTKQGFKKNPNSRGTQGHELLQRIKQLGPVYVKETEDKKFGIKPFQDALGYKR